MILSDADFQSILETAEANLSLARECMGKAQADAARIRAQTRSGAVDGRSRKSLIAQLHSLPDAMDTAARVSGQMAKAIEMLLEMWAAERVARDQLAGAPVAPPSDVRASLKLLSGGPDASGDGAA